MSKNQNIKTSFLSVRNNITTEHRNLVIEDGDDLQWICNISDNLRATYVRTIVTFIYKYYSHVIINAFDYGDNPSPTLANSLLRSEQEKNTTSEGLFFIFNSERYTRKYSENDKQEVTTLDCEIKVYNPCLMKALWQTGNFAEKGWDLESSFNPTDNVEQIQKAGCNGGGNSGEVFFFSHDNRVMFKTISATEEKEFKNILWDYTKFMSKNPKTFITRIFGIMTFEFKRYDTKITIIMMENILSFDKESQIRKYDMKGSGYNRKVHKGSFAEIDKNTVINDVYKDKDFEQIENTQKFSSEDYKMIHAQIHKDVLFFESSKLIDYSLLMGVIDQSKFDKEEEREEVLMNYRVFREDKEESDNQVYCIGVIDYFQKWTVGKSIERCQKRCINCNSKLDTSAQPPDEYAKRFKGFFRGVQVK